jgi:hypothetical protein
MIKDFIVPAIKSKINAWQLNKLLLYY